MLEMLPVPVLFKHFAATVTCTDTIAMPHNVDGSRILMFSYTTSYRCVSQLFCLTCCVKVINTFKQDVRISIYKHTDPSWPHILRTM